MKPWSYPKIYNVGHREVADIQSHPVVVQEKLDGSQFSFGLIPDAGDVSSTTLHIRSKKSDIQVEAPPDLFAPACRWIQENWTRLSPGFFYRGEALCRPKHNTLVYDRAPEAGFVLFDIELGEQGFLPPQEVADEAERLGVERVGSQVFEPGLNPLTSEKVQEWLDGPSMLGGRREGFVIKAYGQYDHFNKTLMAKHVSEEFKEVHQGDWKQRNPGRSDILVQIINDFGGPARWQKAVQHLEESEQLENSPRDIGLLMREVGTDLKEEEEAAIKSVLFKHFWPQIQRGVSKGLPEWYKERLLSSQFDMNSGAVIDSEGTPNS